MSGEKNLTYTPIKMNKRMEKLIKVKALNDLARRNYPCAHHIDHFAEYQQKVKLLQNYKTQEIHPPTNITSLRYAIENNQRDKVKNLLHKGTPVNISDKFGTTVLHLAVDIGDAEMAELLLCYGADPDIRDLFGATPLLSAVNNRRPDLVEKLIKYGCNINEILLVGKLQFATYLHCAVDRNYIEIVELLLQNNINVNATDCIGRTPLHRACQLGQLEIVDLLLKHGADIHQKDENNRSPLFLSVESNQEKIFKHLLNHNANINDQGPNGMTLLHLAITHCNINFVQILLELKINVNAVMRYNRTPLHCAIDEQFWPGLLLLLSYGADVNRRDNNGRTNLYRVVELREIELVQLLIERGADVNAEDQKKGETVLHLAVKQGCSYMTRLLLEHEANVDARDRQLRTPLHLAVNHGQLQVFNLLNRADVNAADVSGNTPLHLAITRLLCYRHEPDYHRKLYEHLLSRGADVNKKIESSGNTPLHLAVKNKCGEIVWDLLCRGAVVDAQAMLDETPLRMAVENQDAECIENLLIFGAQVGKLDLNSPPILLKTFARHVIKLEVAGFQINDKSVATKVMDEVELKELRERCVEEVQRMRTKKLGDDLTYYKFMRGNKRQLAVNAAKPEVKKIFERCQQRDEFPLYANMLERSFVMGRFCNAVLDEASWSLNVLFNYRIPSVPIDGVLDYLVEKDMCNVIESVKIVVK